MNKRRVFFWLGVIVVYLILKVVFLFNAPFSIILGMLPPIIIVLMFIRRKPIWIKGIVLGILVLAAVYVLFNNDIPGPLEFGIRDVPINYPAQFFHSWRFYWVMCYLYRVTWWWGVPSIALLLGYVVWDRIKEYRSSAETR